MGVGWHNQHPGQFTVNCSPQQGHPSSRQQTLLLVASGNHMAITPVLCESKCHTASLEFFPHSLVSKHWSFPGILPSLPRQQTLVCFPGNHVTFRTIWCCLATFSEESALSLYLLISCSFLLLSSIPQCPSKECMCPKYSQYIHYIYIHYRVYVNRSFHSSE